MAYESNKSHRFQEWMDELTPEKILLLIELEKQSRLVVHMLDLTGDVETKHLHGLARVSKLIQAGYENGRQ